MSHVRNLFHNPLVSAHGPASSPVAAPTAAGTSRTAISEAEPGPAVVQTREFPAVEAHLKPENRLVFKADPRSPAADRFRLLRMRLREFWNAGKLKTLLITSPLAGDGKSTVLLNLATALCERGKRSVLVVDSDLHHSSLSDSLGLKPSAGFTECLEDELTSPLSLIRRVEPLGWNLLAAGEPHRNATELLQSAACGAILQKLSAAFDWVLIDSPPVIPLTDALSLQQHAEGTVLVLRAGQTPADAVDDTVQLLGRTKIVAVVLNAVEARNHLYYQYYRYDTNRHTAEDS